VKFFRPHFLAGGVFINLLGIALALSLGGSVDWSKAAAFQVLITSIQLAGAIANEYCDIRTDSINRNRTWFSGGSGEIPKGNVSTRLAAYLLVASATTAATSMVIIAFVFDADAILLLMMALGLVLGIGYSMAPLRFVYRGLGEPAMMVMLCFIAPAASFLLQFGQWDNSVLFVSTPLMFQILAFMMATEYPDLEADSTAGKRNWVVRFGRESAWRIAIGALMLGAASALASVFAGMPSMFAIGMAALLLGQALFFVAIEARVRAEPSYFWSTFAASGFFVSGITVSAGLLMASSA
jgi:1,4-dihydroxy-2-naphthoate octaprenyltransferase